MSLLSVDNLTIRFGGLVAVNNVSFAIEPGDLFGLIGPNGAGKTTVFNMVTGVYKPTSGSIQFRGIAVRTEAPPDRAQGSLSHLSEHPAVRLAHGA